MTELPPSPPDALANQRGPEPPRGVGYWLGFVIGFTARWTLRILLLFALLVLLSYFLIQVPAVQRYAARQASQAISQTLGVEARVGRIAVEPFTSLRLSDVYLGDRQGDTLLVATSLGANFFQPIRSLLNRTLYIDAVDLESARVRLVRDAESPDGNFAFLAEYLSPKPQTDALARDPFQVDLRQLTARNTYVSFRDEYGGTDASGGFDTIRLKLNVLDLPGKSILGDYVQLYGGDLEVQRFESVLSPVLDSARAGADSVQQARAIDSTGANVFLSPLAIELGSIAIERTRLRYQDSRPRAKPAPTVGFDDRDFELVGVTFNAEELMLGPDSLALERAGLRFGESRSAFELEELSLATVALSREAFSVEQLQVRTPASQLATDLSLKLPEGTSWVDAFALARIQTTVNGATIAMDDILTLVPALRSQAAVAAMQGGDVVLSGDLSGTSDNFRVRGLSVLLPDSTYLDADVDIRNVLRPDEMLLNVAVNQLRTSARRLRRYVPAANIPKPLDRLGLLNFTGRFDGFLQDFVAYGDLRTGLGRATLDTRFVAKPGKLPRYSGEATLLDFNLGQYLQNDELGRITARVDIIEGVGVRAADLRLSLRGGIQEVTFRGYTYNNIGLDGTLAPDAYEGSVSLADDHADLDFNGRIDLSEGNNRFDFSADVRQLDLLPLRLGNEDWTISGGVRVDADKLDLDNLQGTIAVNQFSLSNSDGRRYVLDTLTARQAVAPNGDKRLSIDSPTLLLDLSGQYRLRTLPASLQRAFAKTYPALYTSSKLPPPPAGVDSLATRISLDVKAVRVDSLLRTFNVGARDLDGAVAAMTLDTETERLDVSISALRPRIGAATLVRFGANLRGQSGELVLEASAGELNFGAFGFADLNVFAEYTGGDLNFNVSADTATSVLGNLVLAGSVDLGDTAVAVTLDPNSFLDVGGERWTVEPGNELIIGKRRLIANDVELRAGERFVQLETVGARGLDVLVQKFNLDLLNAYLNPDKVQVAGEVDAYFSASDVYARQGLTFSASVDTFTVNGEDWGALQSLVTSDDLDTSALAAYVTFSRLGQQAVLDGSIALKDGVRVASKPRARNYFDVSLVSSDFDMSFLSYFVPGITDLRGKLGADLRFYGMPDKPMSEGGILVDECALTVDYLQTRYFVDSQYVSINSRLLDATGRKIRDRFGNTATLTGGLVHDHLKNWALDLYVLTDKLQVLKTGRRDNPIFYGSAFMSGKVAFAGPFNRTNIVIDATALDGTSIVFPVSGTTAEADLRFIRFRQPADSLRQPQVASALRGLDLDMNLTVTPAAELSLVFDEASGDILRGQGTGTIQIDVRRTGTYSMFGTYRITEGDYLFTLLNVVNKPFSIRPGSTINWDGDPFTADLDITAAYEGLSVAPYGLIAEYVSAFGNSNQAQGARINELAQQPTQVDLLLDLKGDLQRPNLAFAIELPDLQGEIRNYVNSKLALIRSDENELNRQVFGLIVIGQFLPNFGDIQVPGVAFNTLSELFSNQLSYLLTELLTSLAGDKGALSGIDIDINLQNNSSLSASGNRLGNDLQTRLRTYFFDDRLEVGVGANFGDTYGAQGTGQLTAGKFEVTYALTSDRRLRLKTFASTNIDIGNRNRNRAGVGLSWRQQFDSFAELIGRASESAKKEEELEVGGGNNGIFQQTN